MFKIILVIGIFVVAVEGSYPERVRLREIEVLTLYSGKYTNARRSSPIPQLKCLGGTAGCSSFVPKVVQCYNRGSDGYDVQWECKTDMDKAYRFGEIEVSCEGFDYPEDPFILKGSCGLEYKLDLTGVGGHQYQEQYDYHSQTNDKYSKSRFHEGTSVGTYIVLAIVCLVIYSVYKWFSGQQQQQQQASDGSYPSAQPPPPPGFRPEYMPGSGYTDGGCSSTYTNHDAHRTGSGTGGGFWTGAATGGILGYLFGSRNNTGYQQPSYNSGYGSSGWRSSGWGSRDYKSSSTSSNFGSSGSQTASGFGGTKRR